MSQGPEEIVLAEPRGFCAGVDRAIEIVEKALAKFGAPIYVRHEIVHNDHVVRDLRDKGAVFVEDLNEVPLGAPSKSGSASSTFQKFSGHQSGLSNGSSSSSCALTSAGSR